MNRGLTFALALGLWLPALCPAAHAQGIRADTGGIAIGGNVTGSTINIGLPLEKIEAVVRERTKPLEELTASQRDTIGLLKEKLDLNERQIRAALDIVGEKDIPREHLTAKLAEVAERYKELLAAAAQQPGDTPAVAARKAEAQQAIDAGELAKADELLALVETEQRQAFDRAAIDLAETSARRGDLAMTRLRYREAATHFANAAALIAPGGGHEDKRIGYLEKEASALLIHGGDFGDRDALRSAIERCRALIALKPRDRVPLKWAAAQYYLGRTLALLGELEGGAARYKEAIAAYAEARKEFTREGEPLQWATVESSRGYLLGLIGVRKRGTARLDEAIAAYSGVLQVLRRDRSPRQWASAQLSLGIALTRRGERDPGTRRLEAAVTAFRGALAELSREKEPLTWAAIHNNLGIALDRLGQRDGGAARLQEAIVAYHDALKEWTRQRVPMRWASAQNGVANALLRLAREESGTARLQEAIATYAEVLQERTRERSPIDWARTSGSQGVALMLLAERTNNADMADRAVAQIEAALETVRGGGHAPREDFFERQLARAQALAQRLRTSSLPR